MTIFQKMMLAPIISLLLYVGFITYSLFEHQKSSMKVQDLNENHIPILQVANQNVHLFEKLRDSFKDAVLAGEVSWISNSLTIKNQLKLNLKGLESHPEIVDAKKVKQSLHYIELYYLNANTLAHHMLLEKGQWQADEEHIQLVEQYLNQSHEHLLSIKHNVQQGFRQTLSEVKQQHQMVLYWASVIAITSMLLLITITLLVSLSTRRSILQVVEKAKSLALGSTDFSQRIERKSQDELAKLIYWFNKLSDKLEHDYLEVKNISITDKLTQLNNRTRTDQYLPVALEKAKANSTRLFVVLVDIDHFKDVNDHFGHLNGDKVLQGFAEKLKEFSTEHDYISRWGGEEFLLIWPDLTGETATDKANLLLQEIANLSFSEVGSVTVSLGVAEVHSEDSPKSVILRADKNLYQAKNQGRNRVVLN